MSDEIRQTLKNCTLFARVEDAGLARLEGIAQLRRYPRGQVIFSQGEPVPGAFVVRDGLVRVYRLAPTGKEHVLYLAEPGRTFAEVAAVGGMPCPAFAQALEPTTCVLLPTGPLARALQEDHPLCLQLIAGLAERARHMVQLLEDVVLRDASARLARYLLEAAGQQGATVELPAGKRHVASHLNLASETLSRTLRRLADAGLIESMPDHRVRVLDADGLRELAGMESPEE
jgi:CRP/FNR family transcriptional regulator